MKSKKLPLVLGLIFFVAGISVLYFPISEYIDEIHKQDVLIETISDDDDDETVTNIAAENEMSQKQQDDFVPDEIKWDELLSVNSEIVAWIYIPGTNINYPVLRVRDTSEYIRRDIYGDYSRAGTIFIEPTVQNPFNTGNTILYGHNLGNGLMFSQLKRYSSVSYRDNHKMIYIYFPDGSFNKYEVFSFMKTDADNNSVYNANVLTYENLQNYYDVIMNKNIYDDVDVSRENDVLMLSTCMNGSKNTRYVVHAQLVN